MGKGFYTLSSGMLTQSRKPTAVSNNIVNVETTGYKRNIVTSSTFGNLAIHRPSNQGGAPIGEMSMMAAADQTNVIHSKGNLKGTGRTLGFAIMGEDFFVVQEDNGLVYTCNGSLSADEEGYLVGQDLGGRVMGVNGPIRMGTDQLDANVQGNVSVGGAQVGSLTVYQLADYNDLKSAGQESFTTVGGIQQVQSPQSKWKYVEGSDVDAAQEITGAIVVQRGPQTCTQALKMHSQVLSRTVAGIGKIQGRFHRKQCFRCKMRNGFIRKRGKVLMINPFYTVVTDTIQTQKGIDVTANNIINVSTIGFQTQKGIFADLVYTNIHAVEGTDSDLVSGHGAELVKTDTLFAVSALENTSRSLGYTLSEAYQFFTIRSEDTVRYTRNDNFHLSMQGNANHPVSSGGGCVLGVNGQSIRMTDGSTAALVGVFTFSNCNGLQREAGTYFVETEASGQIQTVRDVEVWQGRLENSSISLPNEMVTVLETQRAFQFNPRMAQISDKIVQTVNSLR